MKEFSNLKNIFTISIPLTYWKLPLWDIDKRIALHLVTDLRDELIVQTFEHGRSNVLTLQISVFVFKRKGEVAMAEIIHTSRVKITRDRGPIRIAQIEGLSEPVFYGVHGGIQKFYKVDPVEEHAATLDHIVGAVSA